MAASRDTQPTGRTAPRRGAALRDTDMLLVSGTMPAAGPRSGDPAEVARHEVLGWWKDRSGQPIPKAALAGSSFEASSGAWPMAAVRVREAGRDLWSFRCEEPSGSMPGVGWATEVTVETRMGLPTRIGVREMCRHAGSLPTVTPRVYGFVQAIAAACNLEVDGRAVAHDFRTVSSLDDVHWMLDLLESERRTVPVLVLACADRRETVADQPMDIPALAAETVGIAEVILLAAECSFHLTEAIGAERSVFMGAARAYMPGFHAGCDPYRHPLILRDALQADPARGYQRLRAIAVAESMRPENTRHWMPSHLSAIAAAARVEQEALTSGAAGNAALMGAASRRIAALEAELAEARRSEGDMIQMHDEAEERAVEAELRAAASDARVLLLEGYLREQGRDPVVRLECPDTWDEVAPWADVNLAGRVALTARARRGVRKPEFRDVEAVAGSLLWLATICRDRLMSGGGSLDEVVDGPSGIRNESCGGDTYAFVHEGRRLRADWHVKNGGNTRDPSRCLRIYYGWDEATQRVVVADMPGHRRTDAS